MLKDILELLGHSVIEACNGRKGVELYRAHPADLVITDLIMPDQEGIETITQLIKEYPSVKIVAMSGGGRVSPNSYLHIAERLGAKSSLSKPFTIEELTSAVDAALA